MLQKEETYITSIVYLSERRVNVDLNLNKFISCVIGTPITKLFILHFLNYLVFFFFPLSNYLKRLIFY